MTAPRSDPDSPFEENGGQATKGDWWMFWRQEAMKDATGCDKPRGAAKWALIRGSPNGTTRWGSYSSTRLVNSYPAGADRGE